MSSRRARHLACEGEGDRVGAEVLLRAAGGTTTDDECVIAIPTRCSLAAMRVYKPMAPQCDEWPDADHADALSRAISIAVSMPSVACTMPRTSSPWTCAVTGPVRITTGVAAA